MVYTHIHIVVGQIFTFDEIEDITGLDMTSNTKYYCSEFKVGKRKLDMIIYPCCSDLGSECFILGRVVKIYNRTNKKCGIHMCEKTVKGKCVCDSPYSSIPNICGNYYICKSCLGDTENGYYDVEGILNNAVEINFKHICNECNHDNRKNIYTKSRSCSLCKTKMNTVQNISDNKSYKSVHKDIRKFIGKYKKNYTPYVKFYYMLDDCLACT
jgi:hypothetical protein